MNEGERFKNSIEDDNCAKLIVKLKMLQHELAGRCVVCPRIEDFTCLICQVGVTPAVKPS